MSSPPNVPTATLGRVICPILYTYDCPICQDGGGPEAHIMRYCPENKTSAKIKSSTANRGEPNSLAPQDPLLTQFLGLCLDNHQVISDHRLNSFSSSSSYGSRGLIDPIGTPLNKSSLELTRKLKARQENNIQSFSLNIPATPVPNHSTSKRKSRRGSCMECVFCKNNGQPVNFYQSHVLKDTLGRVICPILYAYDCPICHNGGGPQAHTIRYCPENKPSAKLKSSTLSHGESNLLAPQDTLLAQFLGLCFDNQQVMSNHKLNSFSSSSSYGSHGLIDPIGTPLNKSSIEVSRKLKARQENNIQTIAYNIPTTPVSNHNTSKRKSRRGSCVECVFCKNNGQPVNFYQSHVLKDTLGRVVCPILYAYDCPICHNGGGPQAHTIRYCPENKPSNRLRNALLKSQVLLTNDQSIL